ncbi:hypothetical protein OUZ56_033389 [Daphnia magna]|uniref:HAT C-terminal dimerisation domain-containing protein n=1 Tax=Daphnia magna TaxID=35525 RepID=A0ABQ9ZXS7_9CRUS|nr:hypothetical protein OUZ56_033382 [Daphnia magna]KAK4017688.1 hypothetical protein OUZ56_033385 [Daphnia magna]KAK4017692.1 hypothetical protein OUZ56_033389 [Daphnia magna]
MSLHPETVEALACLRSWYEAGLVGEVDVVKHYEDDVDHASASCSSLLAEEFRLLPEIRLLQGDEQQTIHKQ